MEKCFGCRRYRDKTGVLLAQLGTPDAPTPRALRIYLRQFLSDRRVIELNRVVWWLILNLFVLPFRPRQSAAKYARVWNENGSPLRRITASQTTKLQAKMKEIDASVLVDYGMRYGNPSLESALERLIASGCTRIVLLPMYPQYAGPTTASVYDAFFPALIKRRWVPSVKVVAPFFRDPIYIDALRETIEETYAKAKVRPERLLISFHGIPKKYVKAGDPYCCMCTETARLLTNALSIPRAEIMQTYQSQFGNDPWLTPYTDKTVEKLAEQGVRNVAAVCPGFVADCLETVDEVGNEAAHMFREAGGDTLSLASCVNDRDRFIDCLAKIVCETAGDWIGAKNAEDDTCNSVCPAAA